MIKYSSYVLFLLVMMGCQTPPTKIIEVDQEQTGRAFANIQFGKPWDFKKSIIVDTRSRFEFEMSKTPRSFHMYWKDWSLQGYTGVQLEKRKVELQRRLAIKGVDPLSRVIVFGKGLNGEGEEMLIAATLFSLGIRKIAIISPEKLKKSLVTKDIQAIASLPYWERSLVQRFHCQSQSKQPMIVSSSDFNKDFQLKNQKKFSRKKHISLKSKNGFWAYGTAFQLMKKGQKACVQ